MVTRSDKVEGSEVCGVWIDILYDCSSLPRASYSMAVCVGKKQTWTSRGVWLRKTIVKGCSASSATQAEPVTTPSPPWLGGHTTELAGGVPDDRRPPRVAGLHC